MRTLLVVAAAGTLGCAPMSEPNAGDHASRGAASHTGDIVIGARSNVCVSVRVDQSVWPRPLLPNARQSFSGFLAGELGRIYRERGGSYHLPGPEQIPRFASNPTGNNPRCQERGEDIYVTVSYGPRDDGRPFVFSYRIEQGATFRTGSFSRDLMTELRTGEPRYLNIDEPISSAFYDDFRARAVMILDQID